MRLLWFNVRPKTDFHRKKKFEQKLIEQLITHLVKYCNDVMYAFWFYNISSNYLLFNCNVVFKYCFYSLRLIYSVELMMNDVLCLFNECFGGDKNRFSFV